MRDIVLVHVAGDGKYVSKKANPLRNANGEVWDKKFV
jgi:hypothetical protein